MLKGPVAEGKGFGGPVSASVGLPAHPTVTPPLWALHYDYYYYDYYYN